MIDIVLFDHNATYRIAEKVLSYFSNRQDIVTTDDVIWLPQAYFRFRAKMVSVNFLDGLGLSSKQISECLSYALSGEEVYITNGINFKEYIKYVNDTTQFDKILSTGGVQ